MTPPDHNEKLERAIHQTLRALPPRRAPRSLEARVFAELERRAALPWWRQSFAHWPLAARAMFLLASAGLVKVAIMAAVWVMVGFDNSSASEAISTQFAWVQSVVSLMQGCSEFCSSVFHSIPTMWLYGAGAFVVVMYVTLFGLGAAAYRALYANSR